MFKSQALRVTLLSLFDEKAKKEKLIEKRREQLESSSKASGDKKFKYYIDEKKRNRDKYEALLEKAKADFEKYDQYCDKHLESQVDEDADKPITGYKFELKTIIERMSELEKEIAIVAEKEGKALKERRDAEAKEENDRIDRERRLTMGPNWTPPLKEKKQFISSDGPSPAALYLARLEQGETEVSLKDHKEEEKNKYVASFEDFKPVGVVDEDRKQKAREALEAKKQFEKEVKALLTPDEVAAFDDEYMEGCDKRKIYKMSVEEAKKAIEELAPDIKRLREFRNNSLNLSTDKDWELFDYLKKGYQLEVVNRKCNRNDRDKLVKRLYKKTD